MQKNNILVIGGGISGLATAALLGKEGFDVTLVEKNKHLGGRARQWKSKGYTFDMGPSWYMMPDAFETYFSLFDQRVSDFYQLKQLKNHYKAFFADHTSLTVTSDNKKNISKFEKIEPDVKKGFTYFLRKAEDIYSFSMKDLVYLDYESIMQLINFRIIKKLPSTLLHKTFHTYVKSKIKEKKLQQLLEFPTVFLGGSPYNTPAFYSLIAHTDFNLKIWHPMGGMYKVVEALKTLCKTYGVTIYTGEPVIKVEKSDSRLNTVFTSKRKYKPTYVVNTSDMQFFDTEFIADNKDSLQNKWDKKVMSPSAVLIYLGLDKKLKNVEHHNLYLDSEWEHHFKTVYDNPSWPNNPSYYVHVPTVTDKSLAPKKSETVIFLVPIAPGLKTDKSEMLAEKTIKHFEKISGNSINKSIVVKKVYSHKDFQNDYNAYKGSAFGLAHTLTQTAFLRPKNRSTRYNNLWYAGQYTNPGVGVPTCLISAQITANSIVRWNKKA